MMNMSTQKSHVPSKGMQRFLTSVTCITHHRKQPQQRQGSQRKVTRLKVPPIQTGTSMRGGLRTADEACCWGPSRTAMAAAQQFGRG